MAQKSLRRRVMAGEQVLGSMVFEFFSPGIAQVMKLAGCEYVIYDMEHTGLGFESLKSQVAACRGTGVVPMVRVPRSDYSFLARALDVGARGVMIPMVESPEQARAIVEATRYPPMGRRGAAFGFPHDDYEGGRPVDKIAAANEDILVIAQIETECGLDTVKQIAAVDGIDVLWIGHFDLTNFLGIPGEFDNPRYVDALDKVVKVGRKAGKGLGFMAADEAWAEAYARRGFNMLAVGTDHGILMQGVGRVLEHTRGLGSATEDRATAGKEGKSGKKGKGGKGR